ncbi:MAG: SUMF1/EgtB/PvdO family nonheme iron enzyme [Planctomycetia bacterium]|nr:SUMF1/EgtB/PvdO family nonheme iron enzyme [Planctomycetia bacterium]
MREHRPITIVSLALFALGWATCFYLTGKSSVCSAADVASSVRGKGWSDLKPIVVDAQPDKDVHITSEWKLFLVGTSTYVNMDGRYDLVYTVKDVEALKNRFIQLGVPEKNITVLTSKRHGKWRSEQKNIQEAFENFIANLDSSDYVFVYLSGHGFWFNDDETGYYAPMDLDLNDIRGTCVSIDDMIEALRNSAATFKWMTTDACRNDPRYKSKGREWTFNEATASVYFMENLDLSDDFVFLQSCSNGQRSKESYLLEQGLLTYALLEALQCEDNPAAPYASGELEFGDLIRYVQMRTNDLAHIHHDYDRYHEQTPRVTCGQIPRFTLLTNLRHSDLARSHRQLIEASQNDVELTLHEQETEDCCDNAPLLLSGESETLGSTSSFDSGTPSTLGTSGINAGELLTQTIAGVKVNFRWIPAGTFLIDSPESEQEPKGDQIQRSVELSQGFWIAETETTQELWQAVTGNNPSYFQESNQAPVDSVSWNDCQDFVEKLNSNYGCILPFGYRYSLPTEAQWEYACRAGTSTLFSFGSTLNGDKANCDGRKPYGTSVQGQSRFETSPVKSYEPNAWGVYDMHGNVREWCASMSSTVEKSKSYNRVLRGGSWRNCAAECQATSSCVKKC